MQGWLNYHHLYYFRTIAAEGSIAKAAQKLRLGQPTLSAQLRQLESNLGIRLFERQHKKLILTESGRIALEYASEIFRMGSEMVEVLQDRLVPSRLHVQIGALDSVPKHMIYGLMRAAHRIAPCTVSLLEGKDDELLRELLAHRLDLMLTSHRPPALEGRKLFSRPLGGVPVSIFGAPRFRNLKRGFPKSLDHQPMVLPTLHSRLRNELEHYFRTLSIQPDVVAETQDTSLQKILGTEAVGLIPIADLAVQEQVREGELINLGSLSGVEEQIFLVSAERRIENPVAGELFRKFSLASLREK